MPIVWQQIIVTESIQSQWRNDKISLYRKFSKSFIKLFLNMSDSFGHLADGPLQWQLATSSSPLRLNCITLPTQLSPPSPGLRNSRPRLCSHCYGAVTSASGHPGITHTLPTGVTPRGVVITHYSCQHCTVLLLWCVNLRRFQKQKGDYYCIMNSHVDWEWLSVCSHKNTTKLPIEIEITCLQL